MKKLLFLATGILLFISCSNDTEQIKISDSEAVEINSLSSEMTLKSDPVDPVLKQLYIDMINSQSYIDFNNAIVAFDDKLGDNIPDSELSSSNKILNWVQNNITQTGFQNYQEAVDKWDDVEALSAIAIEANYTFHEYLAGTRPGSLFTVIEEVNPVTSDCPECYQQFLSCSNTAHNTYAAVVEVAAGLFKTGQISKYSYQSICDAASLTRTKADRKCHETMTNCCQDSK
jgi:hypothetical protein